MRVAIVDDEPIACREIARGLSRRADYEIESFADGESFLKRMETVRFDLLLCDLKLPGMDGMEVLSLVKKSYPDTEVIIFTGYGSIDTAVAAVQSGAFHFLVKPVKMDLLFSLSRRALQAVQLIRETTELKKALIKQSREQFLIGHSPAIQDVLRMIDKVKSLNCSVLIQGESGTGKELVARALHFLGTRQKEPFIAFSCGGFSDDLITNELFGHEKGAFTGAVSTKIGLLESADKGTIFLDEIGMMPPNMQVKLLRFIQERNLLRVGGTRPISVDARLIAAGNHNLKKEVELQNFREDLYYRLNVVSIMLPPLRHRKEDIPLLIQHFLTRYNRQFKKDIAGVDKKAMAVLNQYPFPGNVRELENIIERGVALTENRYIGCEDLPRDLLELSFTSVDESQLESLEAVEKKYIEKILEQTGFNKGKAAQILNLPRTTLWRKMKKYKLD
ncbi:sigma-54 dependent transcriptional regulator [uncultured Desulfobacter sp.]|uniref:sigma-54-dependent transcriptional regulator n=1 Tax=uncultured Desulfobacter sp. TaxID=240139 RepID=UPI002AAC3C23|nr:sigma-54 dependent transcriptional regulator [uncultured Desulfobacter sp.]